MDRLANKVSLITGSGSGTLDSILGFGGEAALKFCEEGSTVIISDVDDEKGQCFSDQLNEKGFPAYYRHLNVEKEAEWKETINWICDTFGKLDVLVNNAGTANRGDVLNTTEEDWDRVNQVNAKGYFLGMKTAGEAMKPENTGSIINVSSIYGIVGSLHSFAYHASKGAIRTMTKSAAIQLAKYKIRVNAIYPGYSMTPLNKDLSNDPAAIKVRLSNVPMGNWIPPEQIAWGMVYLASEESSWVTGSDLVIDGGLTAQ